MATQTATKFPTGLVPPCGLQSRNAGGALLMPKLLLCFKKPKCPSKEQADKNKQQQKYDESKGGEKRRKKKRSKSCELRGGILYKGCDCEKRNGLQDDCQRSECRGSPECLTVPPTCGPSEFAGGKHQVKKFEEFIRIKKELERLRKEGATGGVDKKDKDKAAAGGVGDGAAAENMFSEYFCLPLELDLGGGLICPMCNKPIDCPPEKHECKAGKIEIGECDCCPKACI